MVRQQRVTLPVFEPTTVKLAEYLPQDMTEFDTIELIHVTIKRDYYQDRHGYVVYRSPRGRRLKPDEIQRAKEVARHNRTEFWNKRYIDILCDYGGRSCR